MPDGVSFCMFGRFYPPKAFRHPLSAPMAASAVQGCRSTFFQAAACGAVRRPADKDINRAESPIKSGAAKGSSRRSQPSSQAGIPIQRINRYMEAI